MPLLVASVRGRIELDSLHPVDDYTLIQYEGEQYLVGITQGITQCISPRVHRLRALLRLMRISMGSTGLSDSTVEKCSAALL